MVVDGTDVPDTILVLSEYPEMVGKRGGEMMFIAGFAVGLLAGWAVVLSGVVFAIVMDEHDIEEVDEWGKPTWVGKERE